MKKGDVWISTVIYTLIGLSVLAILLAVVRPKIQEMKDSFAIEQTINALNDLDGVIMRVRPATGTRISYVISMAKGSLKIDTSEDKIEWFLENSAYMYSEPDKKIKIGSIEAETKGTKGKGAYSINLMLNYSNANLNLTFSGKDETKPKELAEAQTPYELWVENFGVTGGKQQIDITIY